MSTETIIPNGKTHNGKEYYKIYDKYDIIKMPDGTIECTCTDGTIQTSKRLEARCKHAKALNEYLKTNKQTEEW